jgi:hypothetical protein
MAGQAGGKADTGSEYAEDQWIPGQYDFHGATGAYPHGHQSMQVVGVVDALDQATFRVA